VQYALVSFSIVQTAGKARRMLEREGLAMSADHSVRFVSKVAASNPRDKVLAKIPSYVSGVKVYGEA
jgi:hypothetical protein